MTTKAIQREEAEFMVGRGKPASSMLRGLCEDFMRCGGINKLGPASRGLSFFFHFEGPRQGLFDSRLGKDGEGSTHMICLEMLVMMTKCITARIEPVAREQGRASGIGRCFGGMQSRLGKWE